MADATAVTGAVPRTAGVPAWVRDKGVYVALAVLIVGNLAFTDNFATLDNLRTQLVQVAPVMVVALGMAMVIGTEGIDLSVGSVMAIAASIIPLWLGYGALPAVAVALVAGVACGVLNGGLVAWAGIQPIVATLALFVAGRGLALVLADGQLKDIRNPTLISIGEDSVAGVPIVVLIVAAIALVLAFVMRRSTFGRHVVAVGGNRTAAFLAGLPVKRTLVSVYVISAVLATVAGVLATARLQASDPSAVGLLIELSAITAVVVGGTPLSGGKVRILGTLAGALLMQLIRATLIKHDVADSAAQMVQAAIIVIAVALQRREAAR
jgi:ribose/xylose/arabinose/galactoside ABC-type transport system permease subunit